MSGIAFKPLEIMKLFCAESSFNLAYVTFCSAFTLIYDRYESMPMAASGSL